MDNIEKFQFLKSVSEKTAAETISGLPLTSSNYLEAIELLKARYSNKQIITSKHMDTLMQLPGVSSSEDLRKLRFIYDKTEGIVRSLQGIGITSETYGTFLIPVIMEKLPPDLRLTLSRKLCEEWDLNSLLKASGTELTLREKCSLTSGASATSSRPREERSQQSHYRNNPRPPTTTSTLHNNSGNIRCSFCKGAHFSTSCTIFTDPEERRKILRRKARCFLYLRSGHVSCDCKSEKGCYRRIHHVKFLAFHGNQLEYNGSQGANGAG